LDFAESLLPPVKPKILKFYAKIRRCCKSHAAPFNLLFHNIITNLNGATESLAPYKWCYENKKIDIPFDNIIKWCCELVAPFVRC
jgi:hypothetical protein